MTIRNKIFIDVHLNFLKDISQALVDFEVVHDSGNETYDMVYTNKTIDACMFLENRKLNPIFDIMYRTFLDYGDLPKRCPIRRVRKLYFCLINL